MKKLLYFSSPTCAPCRMQSPIIDELSNEGYNIEKYDVTVNTEVTDQYNIRAVPTMLLINDQNEIIWKQIGATSKNNILSQLN